MFDINVYMDIAHLLGPGFTFDDLKTAATKHYKELVPAGDRRIDSLRAVSACLSGVLAEPDLLQVWTSDHIEKTLVKKLTQPTDAEHIDDRGFGWNQDDAEALRYDVVHELVYACTGGGCVAGPIPHGGASTGHEDSKIYTTAREACDDDENVVERWLVTNDKGILGATDLDWVRAVTPADFIDMVRTARSSVAMQRLMNARPKPQ